MTDPSLRTSHSSRDVFAAGDVAYVPVPLTGDNDANFPVTSARHEHVRAAQDMGALAARVMMGGVGADEPYDPVPCMYSRSALFLIQKQVARTQVLLCSRSQGRAGTQSRGRTCEAVARTLCNALILAFYPSE